MGDTQNEPFANLVAKLRRFSQEQRTGIAFLRPGGGRIISLGFTKGEIVSVSLQGKNVEDALPLLMGISEGRLDFVENLPSSTTTPLPSTKTLLTRLSEQSEAGGLSPSSSVVGVPQGQVAVRLDGARRTQLNEILAEYIGPMASIICENVLAEGQDLQAAIAALAERIPDPKSAQRFVDEAHLRFR